MTRPLRIEFAGAVYHLTSRGNAQQAIFLAEKDFADFLGVLYLVEVIKNGVGYYFYDPAEAPADRVIYE